MKGKTEYEEEIIDLFIVIGVWLLCMVSLTTIIFVAVEPMTFRFAIFITYIMPWWLGVVSSMLIVMGVYRRRGGRR